MLLHYVENTLRSFGIDSVPEMWLVEKILLEVCPSNASNIIISDL